MSHRMMTCWLHAASAVVFALAIGLAAGSASADSTEARKIFTQRCMACHTFGKGVKVGPDLKGVTERRQRPWLLQFIRSSQSVIASGDPVATALFQQFKQQQMPDWLDLSEAQIGDLLDWLAANGPDQQEGDSRAAMTATVAEIERGRRLFHGETALALGGAPCAGCHAAADGVGGSLAPALTNIYSAYQDGALTQILKRPCVMRFPESAAPSFLLAEETFALKAYLHHIDALAARRDGGTAATPATAAPATATAATTAPATGKASERAPRWTPRQRTLGTLAGATAPRATGERLFRELPYLVLALFALGLLARYAWARRSPQTLRGDAEAAWRGFRGSAAWRLGLAATALAHAVGLLAPQAVTAWAAAPWRLYLLEASGFLFGVLALAGWAPLLWRNLHRHETSPRGQLRELFDCLALALLGTALITGLLTAVLHRWGALWAAATVTPYLQSLARGAPAPGLVEQMPFLVRAHVVSWLALVALLPCCSAAAIAVHGLDRLLTNLARPIEACGRAAARARARLSPARWIWPEEDHVVPELAAEDDNLQEQH